MVGRGGFASCFMKRILGIWLPNWPLQRLIVARPELNGRAILIYVRQGNARSSQGSSRGNRASGGIQRVVACSAEATAIGVGRGMPLTEATALVRQSRRGVAGARQGAGRDGRPEAAPGLLTGFLTVPYDPAADERELIRLAEWCEQFSPIVGLEQVTPDMPTERGEPEGLWLDVTGLGPLFGGEEALAEKVVSAFRDRGYQVRAVIADSLGAAWGIARFAAGEAACVVAPGQQAAAMGPLPVAALRVPSSTLAMLDTLGVHRIEQLVRLPRASLSARLGDELLRRIDQAWGNIREPIVAHRPPPDFQADWGLEHPADQRSAVEHVVRHLITRVAHLLAEQNRGALRLEIRLQCLRTEDSFRTEDSETLQEPSRAAPGHPGQAVDRVSRHPWLTFRIDLFRPTAVAQHLFELVRLQFEQATLPGPVQYIVVQATVTGACQSRQGWLFEELRDDSREGRGSASTTDLQQQELVRLVDRLSSRLGSEQVLQPRLVADAQPERACRYVPLAGRPSLASASKKPSLRKRKKSRPKSPVVQPESALDPGSGSGGEAGTPAPDSGSTASARGGMLPADRPLHLLNPPQPLSVFAAVPDGPPSRIQHHHHWHAVVRYWGPERIETGWWRGPTLRRDYYRVETDSGLWLWLFRRLKDGRWFLQGEY